MCKAQQTLLALIKLGQHLTRKLEGQLSVHGISVSELQVMWQLQQAPQHALRRIDLAAQIGLSASGVTRLLLPMEKLHLVSRQANPRDARVSMVKLTDTGLERFNDAMVTFASTARQLLGPLDEQQLDVLLAGARQLQGEPIHHA